jgi:uncharacterized damage-inducible protein DinB
MGDETIRELVYGKGAHVNPVACVEDLSAELASRRAASYPHSIWQVVEHMSYWMNHEVHRIEGKPLPYPEHSIDSFPALPYPAGESQWQTTRSRFNDLLARLASYAEADDSFHRRSVPPDKPSGSPTTVGAVVKQITVHNSYHVGQIAMLRRQFDAWPPQRGGDSW